MSWGRALSSAVAVCAVAVGVTAAVALGHSDPRPAHPTPVAADRTRAAIPATKSFPARPGSATSAASPRRSATPTRPSTPAPTSAPAVTSFTPHPASAPTSSSASPTEQARHRTTPRPAPSTSTAKASPPRPAAPARVVGSGLPLRFTTGNATRVITVVSTSAGHTTAVLQAWTKVSRTRWVKHGSAVTAHIGADGMSAHASESRSATPIGSFTLTLAFGRMADPGGLPYFRTTPDDYWISDEGPLYNTHQRCSHCGYNDGVNERLYYETPFYNYAVNIDYNTRNAPGGVKAGRGSAFFLHVTDGTATAGCVAIPQSRLVPLMRWLQPGTHPRILIGVR